MHVEPEAHCTRAGVEQGALATGRKRTAYMYCSALLTPDWVMEGGGKMGPSHTHSRFEATSARSATAGDCKRQHRPLAFALVPHES